MLRPHFRRSAGSVLRRAFSTQNIIQVDNPYTGEIYCEVAHKSDAEASQVVAKASSAQRQWRASDISERLDLCNRFMDAMEHIREEVARDISCMMGKPYANAYGEVAGVYERTKGMMALAPAALAEEPLPMKNGCERAITKEPVGVVFVIAPWNFPLLTAVNTIVPAVLAGNSVVIKHSPRSPLCGEHFERAFERAGAIPGLVSSLDCSHEVAAGVIANPEVGFVAFTGSVRGGREVYQTVAQSRFIDVTLELGGKDPAYVAPDADPVAAAEGLVDGAMFNAGQSCCGIERVYVHRSKYDAFLEAAKEIVEGYVLGDPMDAATNCGPQALPTAPQFLSEQVKDALAKGATLVAGNAEPVTDAAGKGRFFQPSLLSNCTHEMSIMQEESFGPVLPVVAVDSDEEAVELMKDSKYGLTAAVFTNDQDRVRRMGAHIPTGTVFMNRCDYLDPDLPWSAGGELTGKGVSLSSHGFRGVTKLKGFNMRVA